mgnify:CR=1 FL=1
MKKKRTLSTILLIRFFGKWWLFISLFLDGETNRKRIITIAAD